MMPLPRHSIDEEATVRRATDAVRAGEIVIVTDDERRENEGDLIMAAEAATPDKIAFFLQHTSGVICAALPRDRLDALGLPLMVEQSRDLHCTAFTVSVDLATGITTGISAVDRARTLRALADPDAVADEFVRPGHVFPLRARDGGVLARAGHTEAAVDLARLAGLAPAAVLCEVVSEDKRGMARASELQARADRHGLQMVTIADLVRFRLGCDRLVRPVAKARAPTAVMHGNHSLTG